MPHRQCPAFPRIKSLNCRAWCHTMSCGLRCGTVREQGPPVAGAAYETCYMWHNRCIQTVENALKISDDKNKELLREHWKHEIRMKELAEEILTGNDIVDQMTTELRTLQLKLKRKQSKLCQQVCNRYLFFFF